MSHPGQDSPLDLAAAYALGALSPEETRRFEAYLAGSPEAQREVAEYREVAALLALAGPEPVPAPDLRDRVLARGRASAPVAGVISKRTSVPWLALAAGLAAVVGLGFGFTQLRAVRGLRQELVQVGERLDLASERLATREATLNAILEPGVQMFQLTASGDPDPLIQLFWDRRRHRAVLHGFKLDSVPPGRAYQLWFIRDGAPVPSVTFRPEATGHVLVEGIEVPAEGDVSAAALTVEPEAGSPQPTSPIRMLGQLKRSS
ncbi:MAG TPA: anti-sigma factor [Gemmatimonadales bacterium]